MNCRVQKNKAGELKYVKASNGQDSILFQSLQENFGTHNALKMYSWMRTKEFKDWYGRNWEVPIVGDKNSIVNINFNAVSNPTLSRFSSTLFEYNGEMYTSVSQAYQLAKLEYSKMKPAIKNYLRDKLIEADGTEAHNIGSKNAKRFLKFDSKSWDKVSKNILYEITKASFEQNPTRVKELLRTGESILKEPNGDGEIIQQIREELRPENYKQRKRSITVDDNGEPKLIKGKGTYDIINSKGEILDIESIADLATARDNKMRSDIKAAAANIDPQYEIEALDIASDLLLIIRRANPDFFTNRKYKKDLDRLLNTQVNSKTGKIKDKAFLAKKLLTFAFDGIEQYGKEETSIAEEIFKKTIEDKMSDDELSDYVFKEYNLTLADGYDIFYSMYHRWDDRLDNYGNIVDIGWRSKIKKRLDQHGFMMRDKSDDIFEDDDLTPVKIYNLTSIEENPRNKLSDVAKLAISGIKYLDENSVLGYETSLPINTVYGVIAAATVDSLSFEEMMDKMEDRAQYDEKASVIIERLESLNAQEQAAIYTNFANAYKQFMLFTHEVVKTSEGGTKQVSKMFNPNEKDTARRYRTLYVRNAVQRSYKNDRSLFLEKSDGSLVAKADKLAKAGIALELIDKNIKGLRAEDAVPAKAAEALGSYLWHMGMQYGETLESTQENLQMYFENGDVIGAGSDRKFMVGMELFQRFMDPMIKGSSKSIRRFMTEARKGNNFYTTEGTTVNHVASIAPIFESRAFGSFVSGTGKVFWPINTSTSVDDLILKLKSKDSAEHIRQFEIDPLVKPIKDPKRGNFYSSVLISKLKSDRQYLKDFHSVKMDSFKIIGEEVKDYGDLDENDSLMVRLMAYANNETSAEDNQYTYIAVHTQADRGTLDFIYMPRFDRIGVSRSEIIKGLIVQDYARMSHARKEVEHAMKTKDVSNLVQGYHYKGMNPFAMNGSAFIQHDEEGNSLPNDSLQVIGLEDPIIQIDENDIGERVSVLIDEYLKDEDYALTDEGQLVEKHLEKEIKKVKKKLKTFEKDVQTKATGFKDKIPAAAKKDFFKNYVFNDFVGKIEATKMLRGGYGYTATVEKFYKRTGLLGTPGQRLFIKGESTADPLYGMSPTFKMLNIKDLVFKDTDGARENVKTMITNMVAAGVEKETAKKVAKGYLKSNKTDGIGMISIHMHRDMRMGQGLWDMVLDEQAYENEKQGLGFIDNNGNPRPLLPIKPYDEEVTIRSQKLVANMDKNSYMVVTKDLAKIYPELNKILEVMEKGVGVVNVDSASKGAIHNPQSLLEVDSLDPSLAIVMDSTKLKIPQLIQDKKDKTILFNRQVRKNAMSNVIDDANYVVKFGRKDGYSGKQVKTMYNTVIHNTIKSDIEALRKQLEFDPLEQLNPGTKEYAEAKKKYLMNIRDLLFEQMEDRDLPDNYVKALQVVPNGAYDYRFKVPLSFPYYQGQFEQIFLSIFKNNIFKQKIPGKELVQIPEIGTSKFLKDRIGIDRELRMYDGTHRGEVLIKASTLGLPEGTDIESITDESALDIIGYRVPNQGKNSMMPMRVVGFLPEGYSKSIVVPGGITTQQGSDFDIDKLYIMQPLIEKIKNEDGVVVDLARKFVDPEESSKSKQHNNAVIYNLIDAVASSPHHLLEVLSPLDNPVLDDMAAILKKEAITDRNHPLMDIQMEMRNKTGKGNTGTWALQLAGKNTVQGKNLTLSTPIAVDGVIYNTLGVTKEKMSEEYKRLVEAKDDNGGKYFGELFSEASPETEAYVDQLMGVYISAAVDAASKPIHVDINDSNVTIPITASLLSIGVPIKIAVALVASPTVKQLASTNKGVGGFTKALAKEVSERATDLNQKKLDNYLKLGHFINTDKQLITFRSDAVFKTLLGKASKVEEFVVLKSLLDYASNVTNFSKFNKAVNPENIDNLSEISSFMAHLDIENLAMADPFLSNGAEFIAGIKHDLTKTVQSAYRSIMTEAFYHAEELGFIANSPAVVAFKEKFKSNANSLTLPADHHKFIDKALFLYMLAKESNPFSEMYSSETFKRLYLDPEDNIATRLAKIKKKMPELSNNAFIRYLQEDLQNNEEGEEIFRIKFDNSFKMNTEEKNRFSNAFLQLVSNPEQYLPDPESKKQKGMLMQFLKDVISNQFFTSGFNTGPGSYIDLIPMEVFTTDVLTGNNITMVEYFENEAANLKDPSYFEPFMHTFARNYAFASPGGFKLFPGFYSKNPTEEINVPNDMISGKYLAIKGLDGGRYLYTYKGFRVDNKNIRVNTYQKTQLLGKSNRALEVFSDAVNPKSAIKSNAVASNNVSLGVNYFNEEYERLKNRIDYFENSILEQKLRKDVSDLFSDYDNILPSC